MSISRLGTANMYDRTINNINRQQNELASQMEHTSAGMRVIRPSDDPVAAAQAERARNRLERIASDQRGLDTNEEEMDLSTALELVRKHPVGSPITVYHHPKDPALACIDRSSFNGRWLMPALFAAILLGVAQFL